jgi:hypothetical protein
MKTTRLLLLIGPLLGIILAGPLLPQILSGGDQLEPSSAHPALRPAARPPCQPCIHAHEQFLASDALRGRGSATHDEQVAALYIASQLQQYGVEPAAGDGGYLQQIPLSRKKLTVSPTLTFTPPSAVATPQTITWTYGKDFLADDLDYTGFTGPLQKIASSEANPTVKPGAVVLIAGKNDAENQRAAISLASKGAAAELLPAPAGAREKFAEAIPERPEFPLRLEGDSSDSPPQEPHILQLSDAAFHTLASVPDGSALRFSAPVAGEDTYTWNAVGILHGRDPLLRHSAILLSAHLDHLGIGVPVHGDNIYNGADDDASGVTAVLELARVLGKGPPPRRTVIFALFGSEEIGGLGSTYFLKHSPVPLTEIAANLEFEMIGRADPRVPGDTLWLTGWNRSDLGPTLAAHGAHLVADPHPEQNFFARSDNYIFAKKGVVAQTVSSYGLHHDYHQPSDDLAHLDFQHLAAAIGSLVAPVEWLANSDFTPEWKNGGKP